MSNDWDDFRFFAAVARAGSVRGAADRLGVNASTVTRRLDALEAAVSWARQGLRLRDHLQTHYVAAATLGLLGRAEEARRSEARILEMIPTFSAARLAKRLVYPDERTRQRFVDGLVLAGLPI